ncbi:MAG: phage holin family protein [Bacilli bacterium]|nr:phage holin family protein [Bacilli bacterium]
MQEFINKIATLNEPKTTFLLCGIFVFTDVLTGYLKAFKSRKVNSSISRDGYIKKVGWIVAILLGFLVDMLVKVNLFLVGSAIVCIATEGISVYENLSELGISLPFKKYFEKLDSNKESE